MNIIKDKQVLISETRYILSVFSIREIVYMIDIKSYMGRYYGFIPNRV